MKSRNKKLIVISAVSLGLALTGAGAAIVKSAPSVTASSGIEHTGYYNVADYIDTYDTWCRTHGRESETYVRTQDISKVMNYIIDNVIGSKGGTIYIPTGTSYTMKSTVNIYKSYITVKGDGGGLRSGIDPGNKNSAAGGGGSMLRVVSGVTAFNIKNQNGVTGRLSGITFTGFQLRGDGNNGFGIKSETDTDGVKIEDMVINNVGQGIELRGADAPTITNNWISETMAGIKLAGASQAALITNNHIGAQPKGVSIDMENPSGFNISANTIYPDGGSNISLYNPVHGTVTGNTISSYYNGIINVLPNGNGTYGNGNVISNNVISVNDWKKNPAGRDNKWGIVHVEGYSNRIDGNSIIADNAPRNYTGILIMKGDNNRLSNNSIGIAGISSDAKVVVNGSAHNNVVSSSIANSEFQNGNNSSNKNYQQ